MDYQGYGIASSDEYRLYSFRDNQILRGMLYLWVS